MSSGLPYSFLGFALSYLLVCSYSFFGIYLESYLEPLLELRRTSLGTDWESIDGVEYSFCYWDSSN